MILVLTQCFPPDMGGIENLMAGLAGAFRHQGFEVHVLADRARSEGVVDHALCDRLDRFGGPRPLRRWRKMRRAKALLAQHKVTAIVADSYKSIEFLPQTDVPVLVLAHGMEFPDQPSGRKMRRIRDAFAKASHVIANSQFTLVQARPYLSAATQAVVINPPIGPQPDASASARAAVEAIIGSSHPVLMTLSRLEPRKGVDQVIRSLPLLIRHHPDLLYLVAGGGEDATRLKALAAECGIEPHIRFLGRVDDDMKAALFERANLFAMPVRREGASVEGFGISYCEAAWYGVPALAGQEGGAVDAVTHGVTGLVCDGADQAAVSAALLDLLGDEAQRQRFADAAKQRARGPLQWNEAIKAYLALLPRDRTEAGSAATGSGQG